MTHKQRPQKRCDQDLRVQTDHKVLHKYLKNEDDDGNQQRTTTKGFRERRKKQHKTSRKH